MIEHAGGPFVYAKLGGFTCSVCAPKEMTAAEVEAFAHAELGPALNTRPHRIGTWRAFDKGQLFPQTLATPNICAHAPDRLHWFLIAAELAEKFATETAAKTESNH